MISILSLNIRHGQGSASGNFGKEEPWKFDFPKGKMAENAEAIGLFMKQYSPDVVCVQEGNRGNSYWPDVVRIIARAAGYQNIVKSHRSFFGHGNAILTNKNIIDASSYQFRNWRNLRVLFTQPAHYFYGLNRGFVAAHIEAVGWVLNTHLQPFSNPSVRLAEVREMRAFIEVLHKAGQPIIVTGDFNTWSYDEPCLDCLINGRQSSLRLVTQPPLTGQNFKPYATYPAGDAGDAAVPPSARLDYIFASPGVRILSIERILTGLTDHYGLLMKCERERC